MGKLLIYTASAGSGKTFTLACEYIRLLMLDQTAYRHILAVTFTNKATGEMKQRILSYLYGISHSLHSADGPFGKVKELLANDGHRFSDEQLRQRAKKALFLILHDYSFFRIETIDSFFQAVMRSMAHELQLQSNLNIDLDSDSAVKEAVDLMMESLTECSPELGWIKDYVQEKIETDKSWRVSAEITEFAQDNLFKEAYQMHSSNLEKKLGDISSSIALRKRLRDIRSDAEKRLKDFSDKFFKALKSRSIEVDDLSSKISGPASYFINISKGIFSDKINSRKIQDAYENASKWATKTSKLKDVIEELGRTKLNPLYESCEKERKRENMIISTCSAILDNLPQLSLLMAIHGFLRRVLDENNTFLLKSTAALLNSMVEKTDAPFIFEKLGTQIDYIMIDEFQDTSQIQWRNFRVLLAESLSNNNQSLIVGDIKQSIYRWRGGEWSILANMEEELGMDNADIVHERLDMNHRSSQGVIDFNNSLFDSIKLLMHSKAKAEILDSMAADMILSAYDRHSQLVRSDHMDRGHVEANLYCEMSSKEKDEQKTVPAKEPETLDYDSWVLSSLVRQVGDLLSRGIRKQDICILVRYNGSIPVIARYFSENLPSVNIVSAEAFRLDSSSAVGLIIAALSYLSDSKDAVSPIRMAQIYSNQILGKNASLDEICIDVESFLPDAFLKDKAEIGRMPLYEMAERIISIFGIRKLEKESSYVYCFLDEMMDFISRKGGNPSSFLEYWNQTLCSKTIPSAKMDGISIFSIHKSKGLEFDNVLIPYADWEMERTRDTILWEEPKVSPFSDELELVPLCYGKDLAESIFFEKYYKEKMEQWIDNINLLYVAFTRPKHNLFIYGKAKIKDGKTQLDTVGGYLKECLPKLEEEENGRILFYDNGYGIFRAEEDEKTADNPLDAKPEVIGLPFSSSRARIEFKESNLSSRYMASLDDEEQAGARIQDTNISNGLLLHDILSRIETQSDIDRAIAKAELMGLISSNTHKTRLRALIGRCLSNPMARSWFSGGYKVINECGILRNEDGLCRTIRPDRVMVSGKDCIVVDFKAGKPKDRYVAQVQEYMEALSEMGYENIHGYLWYLYTNTIKEVRL